MTTTTSSPSTVIAVAEPVFTNAERVALAGFLAGYTGLTREAYALDLRQFTAWCQQSYLQLFQARRADIECFARDLEAKGRARATVTRRLCTIAGFYRYAVEEELLDHSPAAHVRRPRLDYESHATGLDRDELGALLVAAGLGTAAEHALISLLALNGLRVSEATGIDIDNLGIERGHRTLVVTRKGGKVVTMPLAPRTARAIDLAIGERTEGPIFTGPDGRRLDRHGAARIVRRGGPPRRDHQARWTPHAEARVHHRCAGCWGAAARCAGSRLACRPENHDALRPCPGLAGPARHVHRRGLCRRGRPVRRRLPGRYDLAHLQAFHRLILGDVYDWAGERRTVSIAKGSVFCLPQHLESYGADIFGRLAAADWLRGRKLLR
jgi:integrase/recombinase XerD